MQIFKVLLKNPSVSRRYWEGQHSISTGRFKDVHASSPKPETLLHLRPWSCVSNLIAFWFDLRYFAHFSDRLTRLCVAVLTAYVTLSCLTSSPLDKTSFFTFFTVIKCPGNATGICFLHLSMWRKKKGSNLASETAFVAHLHNPLLMAHCIWFPSLNLFHMWWWLMRLVSLLPSLEEWGDIVIIN